MFTILLIIENWMMLYKWRTVSESLMTLNMFVCVFLIICTLKCNKPWKRLTFVNLFTNFHMICCTSKSQLWINSLKLIFLFCFCLHNFDWLPLYQKFIVIHIIDKSFIGFCLTFLEIYMCQISDIMYWTDLLKLDNNGKKFIK